MRAHGAERESQVCLCRAAPTRNTINAENYAKLDPDAQEDRVYTCAKLDPDAQEDRVYTCVKLDPDAQKDTERTHAHTSHVCQRPGSQRV